MNVVKKMTSILLHVVIPVMGLGQLYYPQTIPYLSSAKLGEHFTNALNASYNPTVVPYLNSFEASFFAEKKFLADINLILLSIAIPINNNGIAFMFQHFGNTDFSERTSGLNYGKDLGRINMGILFRHINIKIRGATSSSCFQTGLAASMKLSANVYGGIKVIHPVNVSSGKMKTASAYSFILGWESSSVAYAGIELMKQEDRALSVVFTLQYQFAEKYYGGLNWNTFGHQPFICLGWKVNSFIIEAGSGYHAVLGPSPTISFMYKKKK